MRTKEATSNEVASVVSATPSSGIGVGHLYGGGVVGEGNGNTLDYLVTDSIYALMTPWFPSGAFANH